MQVFNINRFHNSPPPPLAAEPTLPSHPRLHRQVTQPVLPKDQDVVKRGQGEGGREEVSLIDGTTGPVGRGSG